MEEFVISAGTIIKLNGIPFELKYTAIVLGTHKNYELAMEIEDDQSESSHIDNEE